MPTCSSTGKPGNFTLIPNGIPSIEERVKLLYTEGVCRGRIDLQTLVRCASTQAAKIFGLYPRKGAIEVGSDADLVIWDPEWTGKISVATHSMATDYSAFEGRDRPGPRRARHRARQGDGPRRRMVRRNRLGKFPAPRAETLTCTRPPRRPALTNKDLAPVAPDQRTWTRWDIAALWVGMAVCIPTYTMASSLIGNGMTWWQALLTVFLGNLIVLIPMTLNAHPGTAYGIPFPVLLRASFGTRGANIAALLRGVVACGWFGIQTWFGGAALHATLAIIFGFDTTAGSPIAGLGITAAQLTCFLLFWAMNVFFIWKGMESIKWLEKLSAPFLSDSSASC